MHTAQSFAVGLLPFSLTQMQAAARCRIYSTFQTCIACVCATLPTLLSLRDPSSPVALREVVAKSVHPFRKMSQSARRRLQSPMSWFCYSNELLSQFLTPSPAPYLMLWGNKERSIRTTKASQTEINKFSFARNFLHPAAVFFLQPLQRARGVIRSCNGNPFS